MRRLRIPLLKNNSAVSYTVSALIITGTTVALVLVASIYAYQVLESQRGATEFEISKKSMLAFNDVLENVAWKQGAVRSTRFTIEYGYLQLVPNSTQYPLTVNATVGGNTTTLYDDTTGFMRYYIDSRYITFGAAYENYILGSNNSVVVGSTDTYGRAVIQQQGGYVSITLDYRTRAMRTSVVQINGETVNYVNIWVIKLRMLESQPWSYLHDFDLKAKTLSVETMPYEWPYSVQNGNATLSVRVRDITSSANIELVAGKVVFNVVVAEVEVSV